MNKPSKLHIDFKFLTLLIIIGLLIVANCVTIRIYYKTFNISESTKLTEANDEISRAKYFIIDWYEEISSLYETPQIYFNEIRFDQGNYTLTVAADRIRAVYPRGARFFQLRYITYIEFFTEDEHINCRFYYLESDELVFTIK